jgi:raffinose/stachyose/melibiose transport system substrate-binding protein
MADPSRRDFLRIGTGALGVGVLLPSPAGLTGRSLLARLAERPHAAASYSYDLWTYTNPVGGTNVIKQMEAAFNAAKQQAISFNISAIAGSGDVLYEAKIQSLISSGREPDVFQNWIGSLAQPFIKAGAVRPLDSWFQQYGWHKILLQDAIDYVTYNGHRYGVPVSLRLMPFWYNKTLFKKVGVSPPKTYAEFEAMNDTLVKHNIAPLASGAIYGWDLMRLFEYLLETTAGPTLHDQLIRLETSWANPAVADAFALLKKWGDKGWIEKGFLGTNPNDADNLFQAGKIAMDLTGGWEEGQLKQSGADEAAYDVFVAPTGHTPNRLSAFSEQWHISSKVSGPRLAALGEYMNWIIQPAQSLKYFYNSGTATVGGIPSGNPLSAKILSIAQTHKTFTVLDEALGQQLANAYFALQDEVCKGSLNPKSAAAQMEKAVQKQRS